MYLPPDVDFMASHAVFVKINGNFAFSKLDINNFNSFNKYEEDSFYVVAVVIG